MDRHHGAAAAALALSFSTAVWSTTGDQAFLDIDYLPESTEAQVRAATPGGDAFEALVRRAVTNFSRLRTADGRTLLPPGVACDDVAVEDRILTVYVTLPDAVASSELHVDTAENTGAVLSEMFADPGHLDGVRVLMRQEAEGGDYSPIDLWIPVAPSPPTADDWHEPEGPGPQPPPDYSVAPEGPQRSNLTGESSLTTSGQPQGALSGRTCYIYGGHGWTWRGSSWGLQRGLVQSMNEDHGNLDHQNFLAFYLFNAGATVVPFRGIGFQPNEVIVDNPAASFSGTWTDSTSTIYYGTGSPPYRYATVATTETATATYTPNIPVAGFYPVYTWVRYGSDRVNQLYRIRHTGGEALVRVNHRRVGQGWVWLGMYHFNQGANPATGSVVISNQVPSGSGIVIADAIRFGNGMGDINDGGRFPSGKPRETESTRYWIQRMIGTGVSNPGGIYDNGADDESDSWQAPPRMAAHMRRADGQGYNGDLYLGIHSNAFSGNARGAVGLITGNPTPNQATYAALLGAEVEEDCQIEDTPGLWPYEFATRSDSATGSYGEITASYVNGDVETGVTGPEMCLSIIEVAFHDNLEDSTLLREPRARNVMARACYHAMLRYFNQFDGVPLTFLPEPPVRARAVNSGSGGVTVSWQPGPSGGAGGDAATSYVVYRSTDGLGFGNPVTTANTSLTVTGLAANTTQFFRVAARNAGGESFPTEVLAVRVLASGTSPILIVSGYDRIDRFNNRPEPGLSPAVDRLHLRQNNSFDYAVPAGQAIANANRHFDTCANEAVISGDIDLANYQTVVWLAGEESSIDVPFTAAEQTAITNFLTLPGKSIFVSGSEAAWHLESQGGGAAFLNSTLRTDFLSDDANVYTASGVAGTIFAGIPTLTFDNGATIYNVDAPDTLQGISGSVVCMRYSGTGTPGAAVQYPAGTTGGRIVFMGFPFEAITSTPVRNQVMAAVLDFFQGLVAPVLADIPDASTSSAAAYIGPTPILSQGTLPVTWSLIAGPEGMTINGTNGVVIWASPVSAGSPHLITIRAANDAGNDDESWLLTVTDPPLPPVIEDIPNGSTPEGVPYTGPTPVLLQGTPPVTWSLLAGPAGMTIDPATGVVSWPSPTTFGSPHSVTIRAENAQGSTLEAWILTVEPGGVSLADRILHFLLTGEGDTAGLDLNQDGLIDAADLVLAVSQ